MKIVMTLSAVVLVVVSATWVYRVNYQTQAALERVARLRADVLQRREALSVLRAEWAYLNRPDRLRGLAALHADALPLAPLVPEQFADVSDIPFPPVPVSARPAAGEAE